MRDVALWVTALTHVCPPPLEWRKVRAPQEAEAPLQLSVAILQAISRSFVQHGITEQQLAEVGLGSALPQDPGAFMSWTEASAALERGFALGPDDATPLWVGAEMSIRTLNVVGLAMMSARTVRHVIEAFIRFVPLVLSEADFSFREQDDEAVFRFSLPPASPRLTRASVEFVLGFCATTADELHQHDCRLRRVSVVHPAPPYAQEYVTLLGCPVDFGASENAVYFDRPDLDLPLPGGDETLHRMLCLRAEHAVASRQGSIPFALRAKEMMRQGEHLDNLTMATVAEHFKLSASAFQRRLKEEGTTYSQLIDEVRRELALEALERGEVPIKELAERLGFSETSAFHRAFRRWTGKTPRQYRDGSS